MLRNPEFIPSLFFAYQHMAGLLSGNTESARVPTVPLDVTLTGHEAFDAGDRIADRFRLVLLEPVRYFRESGIPAAAFSAASLTYTTFMLPLIEDEYPDLDHNEAICLCGTDHLDKR